MKRSGRPFGVELHTHWIDRVAVANGFISGLALYPQVFKILLSGTAGGVSLVSFFIIFLNSVVWSMYAVHRGLVSLLIASLLNSVAALMLLFLAASSVFIDSTPLTIL